MLRQRRMRSLMMAIAVGALFFPAAGAFADEPPECALLQDPEAIVLVSGAGETALKIQCGEIPLPATRFAPRGPTEVPPSPLGVNTLVNNRVADVFPRITQSETSVAVVEDQVLVGFNDSGSFTPFGDFTGYSRSTDGGATWTDIGAPTTPLGAVRAVFGDPALVADRIRIPGQTGVFYFANLGVTAANVSIISVHKTMNGGVSWAQAVNASPLAVAGQMQDKEWLAVDTRASGAGAGNVYVCWRRFGGAGGIQFSHSTDGGATFTQLAASLSAGTITVQGCVVAVDTSPFDGESGNVYVAWLVSLPGARTAEIHFRRSTNRGVTFDPEIIVASAFPLAETPPPNPCGRPAFFDLEAGFASRGIRSAPFPSMAVNPTNGHIYLVWHRAGLAGGAGADIAFSRSTDGGQTFSAPVRINSDVTGQQFFPAIAVNTDGIIKVMYYSTQNSPTDRLIDVYDVVSTDGGTTFGASIRVTEVSFDRPTTNPNFDPIVARCYMSDYISITAPAPGLGGDDFFMAWGDNRLTDMGQPDPDVRFAREETVEVPVDIKPQSCPNPLNVSAQGVLPVAILGTATFDVTQVDATSIRLAGVPPVRTAWEDVATPFVPFLGNQDIFDCTTEGPDGFLDLTLKFDTQAVVAALDPGTDGEVRVVKLIGTLLPEFGGTPIVGADVVVLLRK